MKISTKTRYSLRILLDMAQHAEEGYIPLKTIAGRQGISKKYLDQIMLILNSTDYLKTTRGAQGGYKLARPAGQYRLGDIFRLTEGGLSLVACVENIGECDRYGACMARKVWQGLNEVMANYLDNLTLQDIIDKYDGKVPPDFSI